MEKLILDTNIILDDKPLEVLIRNEFDIYIPSIVEHEFLGNKMRIATEASFSYNKSAKSLNWYGNKYEMHNFEDNENNYLELTKEYLKSKKINVIKMENNSINKMIFESSYKKDKMLFTSNKGTKDKDLKDSFIIETSNEFALKNQDNNYILISADKGLIAKLGSMTLCDNLTFYDATSDRDLLKFTDKQLHSKIEDESGPVDGLSDPSKDKEATTLKNTKIDDHINNRDELMEEFDDVKKRITELMDNMLFRTEMRTSWINGKDEEVTIKNFNIDIKINKDNFGKFLSETTTYLMGHMFNDYIPREHVSFISWGSIEKVYVQQLQLMLGDANPVWSESLRNYVISRLNENFEEIK